MVREQWTIRHLHLGQFLILLESNPVLLYKLSHHRMIIRIELRHCSKKHKLTFMKKRDVVCNLFCAIGDIVCNNHLSETELALHLSNEVVDGLGHQRIHHRGWFVVENRLRLSSEASGNGNRPFHSSAEFA